MVNKYDGMTPARLSKENRKLQQQIDKLKSEQAKLSDAFSRKTATESLKKKLANMSAEERALLGASPDLLAEEQAEPEASPAKRGPADLQGPQGKASGTGIYKPPAEKKSKSS